MIYVHIDAHNRYHRAIIPGERPFTFSNTSQGFCALQKWLREIAPNTDRFFSVTPAGSFGAVLVRRLRRSGAQAIGKSMILQGTRKAHPRLFIPLLTPEPEVRML